MRRDAVKRAVPILEWLPAYQPRWLRADVPAGLTVWALLVPEAMAYAQLAGMPPETGLYAGVGGILGYALFGTSRQLFVGPSSAVAILSATSVGAVAAAAAGATQQTTDFIALSTAMALVVGVLFLAFGVLRFGFLSVFMSKAVLTGFTFGLGLTIAVGQAAKLFGVPSGEGNFFQKLVSLLQSLPDAQLRTTVVGLGSLAVLLATRWRFGHKVPIALIVVAVTIVLSTVFGGEAKGVEVVGEIPASLPGLSLPGVSWHDLVALLPGALGILVIAFAEGFGTAKNYARANHYEVDANQEMIGNGAANLASAFLGGFTVSGSLSRSAAANESGARSQMAMLLCGGITAVTIVAFTRVFEPLPDAVLGAVVIAAVWGTFRVVEMRRLWRIRRGDFLAALGALLGVCAIDILPGLGIAIAISFALLVYRSSQPEMPLLGNIPGHPGYVSLRHEHDAVAPEGVLVMRLDAPLFFANAEAFHNRVLDLLSAPAAPAAIVLDFEGVTFIDTDGADELHDLLDELHHRGVAVAVARLSLPGRMTLRRARVYDLIGTGSFYFSVGEAVRALRGRTGDSGGGESGTAGGGAPP